MYQSLDLNIGLLFLAELFCKKTKKLAPYIVIISMNYDLTIGKTAPINNEVSFTRLSC